MTPHDAPAGSPPEPQSPEEIAAHIEQTRAALTDTVDALSAKLDVKARAGDKAASLQASLTDDRGRPTATAWGAVGAAAAVLALVVWRGSRR